MTRALLVIVVALSGACRLHYTGGAKPIGEAAIGDDWHRATATPVVKQSRPMDCGLAALAMVAGAWGDPVALAELQRSSPPGDRGVKLGTLRDLARARGLTAYAIAGTHADLERELAGHRPVVVGLVLPFEQRRALTHYEVVIAYNPRDGSVVTLDPATGKQMQRTRAVLEAEWKPAGHATLVVVGSQSRDSVTARWPSRSSTTPR